MPPHEWFALHGYRRPPPPSQMRRTIFLCAAQPETSFFVDHALLAPFAGAIFDISPLSVEEFGRHGIKRAQHFQLGWTRTWSTIEDGETASVEDPRRDVDVLHLGNNSERRALALAAGAATLSRFNAHLILGHPEAPNHRPRENFAVDDAKLSLLRRTRVLLNIHQGPQAYFEWLRVVQAMSQGCAVVTEHSLAHAPLELGTHMLGGALPGVVLLAAGLLDDPDELRRVGEAGHRAVREEFPLRQGGRALRLRRSRSRPPPAARAEPPAPGADVPERGRDRPRRRVSVARSSPTRRCGAPPTCAER